MPSAVARPAAPVGSSPLAGTARGFQRSRHRAVRPRGPAVPMGPGRRRRSDRAGRSQRPGRGPHRIVRRPVVRVVDPMSRPNPVAAAARRFTSPLHEPRTASWLGLALGVSFAVCFATGVLSHLIQQPPDWFEWPARPAWAYRVTQGLHVATGIATVPLLLVKLSVVYPKLWAWPPVRG